MRAAVSAAVPGQTIAEVVYNPAAKQQILTTATGFSDVDAVNAAVTFTMPSTGAVFVEVSAFIVGNNTGAGGASWCLREGAAIVAGTPTLLEASGGAGQRVFVGVTARFYVTGAAGAVRTLKLAQASGSAGDTVGIQYGGNAGTVADAGPLLFVVQVAT